MASLSDTTVTTHSCWDSSDFQEEEAQEEAQEERNCSSVTQHQTSSLPGGRGLMMMSATQLEELGSMFNGDLISRLIRG